MASQILTDLLSAVNDTVTVEASAVTLINGIAQKVADAVAAALANGASADELAPVQAVVDGLKAQSAALSAAVLANTPAAPPVDPNTASRRRN